jgi:hypothetical protein
MNDNDNLHLAGRHLPLADKSGRTPSEDDPDHVDFPPTNAADYKSYARAWIKPVRAIHFFTQDGRCRTFEYADLRTRGGNNEDFESTRFTLAFLGMRAVEVTVEGRDLWPLYDYIHQARMPWVIVAARDFARNGETIVTRVTFTNLKPEE